MINTSAQQIPANSEAAQSGSAPKPHWLVKTTHWLVNFLGIGLVLNAFLSVKVYNLVKENKPEILEKGVELLTRCYSSIAKAIKKTPLDDKAIETVHNLAKDSVKIAGLGTGGFLVLPLQGLYSASREHISRCVENGVSATKRLFKKPAPENEMNNPTACADHPVTESKESLPHWFAARSIAFFVGCAAYILMKYLMPEQKYKKANDAVAAVAQKILPKFLAPTEQTVEHYMADGTATIAGIATLAITKSALDKLFPPTKSSSAQTDKRTQILSQGPTDLRTRAETKSAGQPAYS